MPKMPVNQTGLSDLTGREVEQTAGIGAEPRDAALAGGASYGSLVRELIMSSGLYAVASLVSPLVSFVLSPFLTRTLSRSDYGALAVMLTLIALAAGITQLGLGSAFFRAYNYDYETQRDRLGVVSTTVALLSLVCVPAAIVTGMLAPRVAALVFGASSYADTIRLAAIVVLLQDFTVPGLAWLRAQGRAGAYSALSLLSLCVTLACTILFVGALHLGVAGALAGSAAGYGAVVACTLPLAAWRARLRPRLDIAWNLLSFGFPGVFSVIALWILQLSDRYLLSRFGSLAQTASYSVAYSLGGLLGVILLSPFQLAWPAVQYAIAKKEDARLIFRVVFRWYSCILLFATYGLSVAGMAAIEILFPGPYHSAAYLIPIIGLSMMFSGTTNVLGVGIGIRRKVWLGVLSYALSAIVNVALNLIWIPRYGAAGAAASTLVAYALLAVSSYGINQWIYPVPFEIGRAVVALLVGMAIFIVCSLVPIRLGEPWRWSVRIVGVFVYGAGLILLAGDGLTSHLPGIKPRRRARDDERKHLPASDLPAHPPAARASDPTPVAPRTTAPRVCMHVLGAARTDVRVMREATALARSGLDVSIVDVEPAQGRPRREEIQCIPVRHIATPGWFIPTRFKPWFLVKAARMLAQGTIELLRTPADVYHAHDFNALPACHIAARLRHKRLIYDAHELPLVEPQVTRWRRLCALAVRMHRSMMPRCSGVITVSQPIARELERRYRCRPPVVARNILAYQVPAPNGAFRQLSGIGAKARIALYQGNLQGDRGLDALVRAAKFLDPDITIVMMGHGPLQADLETLIEQDEVHERVKIVPPVAYMDLLAWTASADIGLVVNPPDISPNVRMSLPNKLFEYLMSGVPVLAARLEAVEVIIEAYGVGRIIDPLEPETIGRAISAMLADRDALAHMRRNALAASRGDLCWESEQRRLLDLYRKVLDAPEQGS